MNDRFNVYLVVGLFVCVCLSIVVSVSPEESVVSPFDYEFVDAYT